MDDKDLSRGDEAPNYEGQLLKFTNVVKGYQYRWFVINNKLGTLDYYEKPDHKLTMKPRGHISLIFAEVNPSVDDSNTFIIYAKIGNSFKLKAMNTKERQLWINNLRSSILYFNKKFEEGSFRMHSDSMRANKSEQDTRSSMISMLTPSHDNNFVNSSHSLVNYSTINRDEFCYEPFQKSKESVIFDEHDPNRDIFRNVNILISQMDELYVSLSKDIESLPSMGSELTFCDKNLLLTKATSSAAIDSLKKCVSVLKHQKIAFWKLFNKANKTNSDLAGIQNLGTLLKNSSNANTQKSNKSDDAILPIISTGSVTSLPAALSGGTSVSSSLSNKTCIGGESLGGTSASNSRLANGDNKINSAQSHNELNNSYTKLTADQFITETQSTSSMGSSNIQLPIDGMDSVPCNPIDLSDSCPDQITQVRNNQLNDSNLDVNDPDQDSGNNENEQVDEKHKSVIQHLISQVKLGMDLTKVTLPTFILEKRSLLEMFADFMAHPQLFLKINEEETPEKRMKSLVIWYLTSFHSGKKCGVAKKPYNPIIGETFHCMWHVPNSANIETQSSTNIECHSSSSRIDSVSSSKCTHIFYCAEQVSHHPPITAFHVNTHNMTMSASVHTRSKFHGMSVTAHMLGTVTLRLTRPGQSHDHEELYQFTLPNAHARNLLSIPKMELGDKVTISSPTTKYSATIVFHTKVIEGSDLESKYCEPMFGNSVANKISGEIKDPDNKIFIKIAGEWNKSIEFQDIRTDESSIINVSLIQIYPKYVKPLYKQKCHESRKLWSEVTEALHKGDIDLATKYKSQLEVRQRQSEKSRLTRKLPFPVKYFQNTDSNYNETVNNWLFKNNVIQYKLSCPY